MLQLITAWSRSNVYSYYKLQLFYFFLVDKHTTELDHEKITGDELDSKYVVSSRIRTGRNIRGYALSPHVCRAERRQIETTVSDGKIYCLIC